MLYNHFVLLETLSKLFSSCKSHGSHMMQFIHLHLYMCLKTTIFRFSIPDSKLIQAYNRIEKRTLCSIFHDFGIVLPFRNVTPDSNGSISPYLLVEQEGILPPHSPISLHIMSLLFKNPYTDPPHLVLLPCPLPQLVSIFL